MAKVSNLKLALQNGTNGNTLFATWDFVGQTTLPGSGVAKKGDIVRIKPGVRWYNGVGIPSWVSNQRWYVSEIYGDRAVLDRSPDSSHSILSPIRVSDITPVQSTQQPVTANTLDHYRIRWFYDSGNGVWFSSSESTTTEKNATFSIPSNAIKVRVIVTPVAKQYGPNNTPYWTGVESRLEYVTANNPPGKLSAPSVSVDKFSLKATIENIDDAKVDQVEFEVYKENSRFNSGVSSVVTARVSYSCTIVAGSKYRVRCRAINLVGNTKVYGEWSPYSTEQATVPSAVSNLKCDVESESSVRLSWTGNSNTKSYIIEYTTNKQYFDSSTEVKNITVTNSYAFINGLERGKEWFFRVRAKNEQGESAWSDTIFKVIGTKPVAPTTWSLTTTAVIGEPVILYWVHNTEDGSKQTQAQIEVIASGKAHVLTVDTPTQTNDKDRVYSHKLDMSGYPIGAEILWRVRTRGITNEYSEWSIQRSISLYAPPAIELHLGNDSGTLLSFPFNISFTAGPANQQAISCHISIAVATPHTVINQNGVEEDVVTGTIVFSRTFNMSSNEFSYNLTPDDVTLTNYQSYTITVTVAMNSGLTSEVERMILVNWKDSDYNPDASVVIDKDNLCAYITPYCFDTTGRMPTNAVLAVSRINANASITPIATNITNDGLTTVTDPHPSLNNVRYRITARNATTSTYSYSDTPYLSVNEHSIVIQWDEEVDKYTYRMNEVEQSSPWRGTILRLPYNIDISESYDPDVALTEYIGREHPVSYYGTQKGVSSNWSAEIPATDTETIQLLRRLGDWVGDVYVREPSGLGYLANVRLSMSIKHTALTVPISLTVKRVGGNDA